MKTGKQITISIVSIMLLFIMGCEKDTNITDLYHTWKLEGFGNTTTTAFEKAEPLDCENCYEITFSKELIMNGISSTNTFTSTFEIDKQSIKITNFNGTEIVEIGNGQKFIETIPQIENYEIMNAKLRLYYNQNKNYLLFKLLN